MKKIFVSTGLAALGALVLPAANGQGLDVVSPKAWSISGTLRGFYDDNYNIAPTRKGSWGTEVLPTVSVNLPLRQTDMGIRYTYGLYYYNDRDQLGVDPFDQTHQVDVWLQHAINERWKINFTDTFTYGRSPDLTTTVGTPTTYRINSDNLANHANISLDTQWTRLFGTSLHYGNDYYTYDNSGATIVASPSSMPAFQSNIPGNHAGYAAFGNVSGASLAGLLNRVEQNVGLDLNWTLSPETLFFVGYTFSWVNYIGNEPIAILNYQNSAHTPESYVYNSNARDGVTQEGHVGLSRQLTGNLSLALQAGASYTDNSNDPFNNSQVVSPTANVSLTYTYSPGSYVQVGVGQAHNATDVTQPGATGGLTQYQDTTTVFADLNHKLTDKLIGSFTGQYTHSTFEGGFNSSQADDAVNLGANLTYEITRHFSADLGYNFDDLFSGIAGRAYVRNRVYLGMTASY